MNKKIIILFAAVLGAIGSYVPTLLGDDDMLSGWGIIGGLIGGLAGIWLGVKAQQRFGE